MYSMHMSVFHGYVRLFLFCECIREGEVHMKVGLSARQRLSVRVCASGV